MSWKLAGRNGTSNRTRDNKTMPKKVQLGRVSSWLFVIRRLGCSLAFSMLSVYPSELYHSLLTCWQTYIVGTVVNFFPTVVGGLGYDRNKTYGLTAVRPSFWHLLSNRLTLSLQPPFVLCVICMLINGFHSDKVRHLATVLEFLLTHTQTQERFYHIVGPLTITLVANIIAVSTLNIAARCKPTSSTTPCSLY